LAEVVVLEAAPLSPAWPAPDDAVDVAPELTAGVVLDVAELLFEPEPAAGETLASDEVPLVVALFVVATEGVA
jgi:hypothetical protein